MRVIETGGENEERVNSEKKSLVKLTIFRPILIVSTFEVGVNIGCICIYSVIILKNILTLYIR